MIAMVDYDQFETVEEAYNAGLERCREEYRMYSAAGDSTMGRAWAIQTSYTVAETELSHHVDLQEIDFEEVDLEDESAQYLTIVTSDNSIGIQEVDGKLQVQID
jgi:hypothetical protein